MYQNEKIIEARIFDELRSFIFRIQNISKKKNLNVC